MRDDDDTDTIDWVKELNFSEEDVSNNDEQETSLCSCCRQHQVSQDQEACQIVGEICTTCNFYEWE